MWFVRTMLVLALSSSALAATPAGASTEPPSIAIESDSPAWIRQVEWAIERFEAAGLTLLPSVTVEVHDGDAACHGNTGLYEPGAEPVVHLCASAAPGSRVARLITLHELGHAWAETQLGPDERGAFLELRGLDVWLDGRVEPHEWGAEHAAEVISWGLMDEPVRIIRVADASPAELATAFEQIAGRAPLHGSAPRH